PLAETLVGSELNTPLGAAFLLRWPDLESVQKAGAQALQKFFYGQNSRSPKKMAERQAAVKTAQALTTDTALIVPARLKVLALAAMLKPLHKAIAELDRQ